MLSDNAPSPFWVYSQTVHRMIILHKSTELILLDDYDPSTQNTECFAVQNIVTIPTEYIKETSWN